jgi:hypothetical protein
VFILKGVKVLCFDTLSQVFILKELSHSRKTGRNGDRKHGDEAPKTKNASTRLAVSEDAVLPEKQDTPVIRCLSIEKREFKKFRWTQKDEAGPPGEGRCQ